MKREDYEWLIKVLASVINAAERGNEMSFHVTCYKPDDLGKTAFYLSVCQFNPSDPMDKLVRSDSWMVTKDENIFGDPEEILKAVNAL